MTNLSTKHFISFFFLLFYGYLTVSLSSSCSKEKDPVINPDTTYHQYKNGLFIINEGLFNHGNSTISFHHIDSQQTETDVFSVTNNKPLGDVGFSMIINDDTGFIVVNNSGKIEVVDMHNMKIIKTIEGLISPRFILPVSKTRAYVSSLLEPKIHILDLESLMITGSLSAGRTAEQMLFLNNLVYAASWSQYAHPQINNNQVLIINPLNDVVIDSISVTKEPNSMVIDKDQNIWVLCSGGYNNEESPALLKINTENRNIEKILTFSSEWSYPSRLVINNTGDKLYYLDYPNVFRFDYQSESLPVDPFIDGSGKSFYALEYDSTHDYLIVTDAKDYQQIGTVNIYLNDGTLFREFQSGINPGFIMPFSVKESK